MKKLLLCYPNQRWLKYDIVTTWDLNPATLCQLAVMVNDFVEVKIIDAQFYDLSKDDFENAIKEYMPDFVGVSILTTEYASILDTSMEIVKNVNQKIVTIAGGVHCTVEYTHVAENSNIDYVIRGEGEYTLRSLLRYLVFQEPFPAEGVVYRDDNRNIIVQEHVLVKDLEQLPWPDFSYVKLEDYLSRQSRKGPNRPPATPCYTFTMTRGCPFGCSFCQVEHISGKPVRARNPDAVVEHLLSMKKQYGIKSLILEDDNILGAKGFFKKLLIKMIESKVNLPFIMNGFAVFLLTDELLDLMKEAGCVGINVAVESGNQRVLKEIVQKPVKLEKVIYWIEKVKQKRMFVLANFIIGFPGEKWNEIRDTIKYAEECGADYVKIFLAVPMKNTKLWDMTMKLDAFMGDPVATTIEWRFSQIKSEEWTPKDIAILRAYEWDRINFTGEERRKKVLDIWGISEDEMDDIRKKTRDSIEF